MEACRASKKERHGIHNHSTQNFRTLNIQNDEGKQNASVFQGNDDRYI